MAGKASFSEEDIKWIAGFENKLVQNSGKSTLADMIVWTLANLHLIDPPPRKSDEDVLKLPEPAMWKVDPGTMKRLRTFARFLMQDEHRQLKAELLKFYTVRGGNFFSQEALLRSNFGIKDCPITPSTKVEFIKQYYTIFKEPTKAEVNEWSSMVHSEQPFYLQKVRR